MQFTTEGNVRGVLLSRSSLLSNHGSLCSTYNPPFHILWTFPLKVVLLRWMQVNNFIILLIGLLVPEKGVRNRHWSDQLTQKFFFQSDILLKAWDTFAKARYFWTKQLNWLDARPPYSGANWQFIQTAFALGGSCKRMRKLSLFKDLYFWQDYAQQ